MIALWLALQTPPDLATEIGGQTLGDALMAPTRLYVKPVLGLLADLPIAAMAHITGGGITENIIRVVPDGLGLRIDGSAWPQPPPPPTTRP